MDLGLGHDLRGQHGSGVAAFYLGGGSFGQNTEFLFTQFSQVLGHSPCRENDNCSQQETCRHNAEQKHASPEAIEKRDFGSVHFLDS
jgi:hypothetical protein